MKTIRTTKQSINVYIRWLLFKKNTILVRKWLRVIVSMLGTRSVPSLQRFSNAKRAFINDTRIVKIYAMVKWPRIFRNVSSISTCFDITDMFLLASFKTPAGFTYMTQITIGTGHFINLLGLISIDGLNLGEGNSCCKEFVLGVGWHHWGLFFHLPSSFLCEGGPACFMEDRSRGVKNKILSLVISLVKQIRIAS